MFTALRILSTYDLITAEGFSNVWETDRKKERNDGILHADAEGTDRGSGGAAEDSPGRVERVWTTYETLVVEDWVSARKTAWALGYLGDPRALVTFLHAMKDELEE